MSRRRRTGSGGSTAATRPDWAPQAAFGRLSSLMPGTMAARTIDRSLAGEIDAPGVPLVVIEAPAGYGKSSLIALLSRRCEARLERTVFFALDSGSCDLRRLLSALGRQIVGDPRVGDTAHDDPDVSDGRTPHVVDLFCRRLEGIDGRINIFIDNLNEATDAILPWIALLSRRLARTCRFVVATRVRALAGLSTLIADDAVLLVGADRLRFDGDEAGAVLGPQVSGALADRINRRVDGWPIMVRFVRQIIDDKRFSRLDALAITGDTDIVAEYLHEQVFSSLSEDRQRILLSLSICNRFNEITLNHVCDRADGWGVLPALAREVTLTRALDPGRTWYQFQPLFREFLQDRLKRSDSVAVADLHRKAADSFLAQGLRVDAITHMHAAGDTEMTASLLSDAGGWIAALRGGMRLLQIIAALPSTVRERNPYLGLGHVYFLAQTMRLQDARTTYSRLLSAARGLAFREIADRSFFDLNAGIMNTILLLYESKNIGSGNLQSLQHFHSAKMPEDLSPLIEHLIGFSHYFSGDYHVARRVCEAAATRCIEHDFDFVAAYSYLALGDLSMELGELDAASDYLALAERIARENFGADSNQCVAAQVFQAELNYERGHIDRAANILDFALPGLEQRDPWSSVYISAHRVTAELVRLKHGEAAALSFLQQAIVRLDSHELAEKYTQFINLIMLDISTRGHDSERTSLLLKSVSGNESLSAQQPFRCEILVKFAKIRQAISRRSKSFLLSDLSRMASLFAANKQLRRLVKLHVLSAAIHHSRGHHTTARSEFNAAVTIARTTGLIMPIIEEHELVVPMIGTLHRDDAVFAEDLFSKVKTLQCDVQTALLEDFEAVEGSRAFPHLVNDHHLGLSNRERQLLFMLADGLSAKEIASELELSVSTVSSYKKTLYRKFGASSRSEAISVGKALGHL